MQENDRQALDENQGRTLSHLPTSLPTLPRHDTSLPKARYRGTERRDGRGESSGAGRGEENESAEEKEEEKEEDEPHVEALRAGAYISQQKKRATNQNIPITAIFG